jgi:HD superfamily phosphohydrolase
MTKPDIDDRAEQSKSEAYSLYEVKAEQGSYLIGEKKGGDNSDEGIVYRAIYRDTIVSAFKAIKVDDPQRIKEIIEPLINEVKLLSLLRHSNLVRIIDYGDGQVIRKALPREEKKEARLDIAWSSKDKISQHLFTDRVTFIAMDYVEGQTLDDRLSDALSNIENLDALGREDFLQKLLLWLCQISEVIEYLHQRGILHMDVKPKNIIIESRTNNAVLIDLGDAVIADIEKFRKYFETESMDLSDHDEIRVLFDPDFAWQDIRPLRGKTIPRVRIQKEFFPKKDLYAFGLVIKEIVEKICSKDVKNLDIKNFEAVNAIKNSEIVRGLREVALRLTSDHYENGSVAASSVQKDLGHLNPRDLCPFGVPELSTQGNGIFIQLSGDSVWISRRLSHIIDHPFFQRLRYITQLNYVHLIYPDALHSRFSHCIYAYDLTRRAILSLLSDINFRIHVDACDIEGALLYSLLHDIGHYPLSHMFEDIPETKSPRSDPIRGDERLFKSIVEGGDDTPTGKVIKEKSKELGRESIADLIIEYFGKSTLMAMYSIWASVMEEKAERPIHRVLAGLISSAVDMDKVAYLSTDSAMSGVNFGKGIDIQTFIHDLKMPSLDDSNSENMHKPILALSDKGFAAAESIILARYWMLSRVYWHHTNREFMSGFKFLIQELLEEQKLKFSEYFKNVFWGHEKDATDYLVDIYKDLPKNISMKMINPLEGITEGVRLPYKRFFVMTSGAHGNSKNNTEEGKEYERIYDYLLTADEFKVLEGIHTKVAKYLNETAKQNRSLDEIKELIFEEKSSFSLKLGCFLIDVPRKRRDILDLSTIYVISSDDNTQRERLSYSSQLLSNLSKEFLIRIKKCRIFIHPRLYKYLEQNSLIDEVRKLIFVELQHEAKP